LNLYDVIGLTVGFNAKFVKKYVDVRAIIGGAVSQFIQEVKTGTFPDDEYSYGG
jgi:3-methyl-2-oxobutanoate hydroxymethyltransferase